MAPVRVEANGPWQRERRWAVDPGLGLAAALGLLAAWPMLTRPSLPSFTDTEQHIYRTFEILSAWRAGVPYLRWAPDLYHGFGYPVFNYYAPLTYYLGALYGAAFGSGGAVAGIKFVYIVAALAGPLGTYLFVREGLGSLAGLVAAAAFAFNPYVLAVEPETIGRAPEALAVALTPLAFWGLARLRRHPSAGRVLAAGVLLALALLAHNLIALTTLALLAAWMAGTWPAAIWPQARTPSRAQRLAGGAAVALALGLVAFFWLPALAEGGLVQLSNASAAAFTDYRDQFVTLASLLRPATIADVTSLSQLQVRLGLPQWLLALAGLLAIFFGWRAWRREAGFFGLAGAGLLFFILPASRPIWDAVKPLALLQFPWRLLGPLSFVLAVLAGSSVAAVQAVTRRWGAAFSVVYGGLALAACLAAGVPLLQPLPWGEFGPVTAQNVLKSELDWAVGTTVTNEFLPAAVKAAPPAQTSLLDSYGAGLVDKVNHAALPAGTAVDVLEHGPNGDRMAARGDTPFVLRLYTFDFSGWTAAVDGRAVDIAPSEPEGWITLNVPAGEHEISVRFGDTWARRVAWAVTGLACVAGLSLGVAALRRRGTGTNAERPARMPWRLALALSTVLASGLILNLVAQSQGWWPARLTSSPGAPTVPVPATFESQVGLLGFDMPARSARPGQAVAVTLWWTARGPVSENLRVFVHFIGPDGQLWANSDKFHPGEFGDFPTSRWPAGYRLRDAHQATLSEQAPPGAYRVEAGLWNELSGQRMAVLDAGGTATTLEAVVLTDHFQVGP